jgi:hypothetical protein
LFADPASRRDIGRPSYVGEPLYEVKSRGTVSVPRGAGDGILDERYDTVRSRKTKVACDMMEERGFKA